MHRNALRTALLETGDIRHAQRWHHVLLVRHSTRL
jgi:hypothetical protein